MTNKRPFTIVDLVVETAKCISDIEQQEGRILRQGNQKFIQFFEKHLKNKYIYILPIYFYILAIRRHINERRVPCI